MSLRHPSGLRLSRFADGELEGRRERAVARHVETCAKCREYVAFIGELGAVLNEPASGEAGETPDAAVGGLADGVLRRRRAGERVALWTPEAGADAAADGARASGRLGPAWRVGLGIAATFVLLTLAGIYLFEAPPVAAGHSELQFTPGMPEPGATVSVRYEPATYLAGYDSLRLRLRTRTADTPYPRRTGVIGDLRTAALHRERDGSYAGRLRLEPGELYLAAAVEDFSGENVDTNLGRLWDVLVATEDGRPSSQAIESRYRVLEAENYVQALFWAGELTEQYPESPFGWASLRFLQTRVGPFPMPDSLAAFHHAKLRKLVAAQARRPANVEEVIALFNYARWHSETHLRDSLFAEVKRLDPRHRAVLAWEAYRLSASTAGDPEAYLREIEPLWMRSDRSADDVVLLALSAAGRARDRQAVRTWIERGLHIPSLSPGLMATELDRFEFAAAERARLRRDRIRTLEAAGDESRPLNETVEEYRHGRREQIRRLQAKAARDLAITGNTNEALALFREAAREAWDPELLRPYADLLLATGDTATALPLVGLLTVDPVSGSEFSAAYGTLLGDRVNDPAAFARLSATELSRRVRSSTWRGRRLPGRTVLYLANGKTTTAEHLLAGAPTIIVFFEPDQPGVAQELAEMHRRAAEILPVGVHLLFVAEKPSPEVSAVIPSDQLAYDPDQTIAQYLQAFMAVGSVVLDADLTASVPAPDFEAALRIAGAL